MRLYHGTDKSDLEYLDNTKSKPDNDFGIGLYLTSNICQAKKWAKRKSKCTGKGAVYESEIDLNNISLNILEYTGDEEDYNYLCYLCRYETEVVVNEIIPNFESVDIICGPMIGNSGEYKSAIDCFHGEDIPFSSMKDKIKYINYNVECDISNFEDLESRIKLYGDQYCFKSKRVIEMFNKGIKQVTYIEKINGKTITSTQLLEYDKKLNKIKYI